MLINAQAAVAKSLEVDWFRRYAATFSGHSPRTVSTVPPLSPTTKTKAASEKTEKTVC